MKRRWKSIQSRLLLLLLLVLVPVVAIQTYMYYALFQERKAATLQTNVELARGVVKTFERFVQEVLHQELSIGLALTSYQKLSPEAQNRILLRSHADNPGIWEIFWANPSGVVLAATGPQFLGMRLGDRDYFSKIVAGQDYVISDLLLSRTTAKPSFTISRGIRDEQGVLLGIVIASILPERLDEELGVKRILGGGFALVDTKGMMVYRYPAIEATWEERNWLKQYPQFADALKGKEAEATVYAPFEGKNRLVGFTPVPSIGWAASAGQREEEVTGPIWAAIGRSAILFGSVLLVAFLLAIVFSRKIANPVEALRRQALALGGGEEREQIPVQSISEFKDLADTFDVMAENLRMRQAALRESEERFSLSMEATNDGLWDWNAATDEVYYSPSYYRILGYEPGGFPGTLQAWRERVHPEDLERTLQVNMHCVEGRSESFSVEYRLKARTGQWRWILARGKCITRDPQGRAIRLIGTHVDITERKQAEVERQRLLAVVQSERDKLTALVNSMTDEIWFADADKKVTLVNPAVWKEFGSGIGDAKEVERIAASFEVYRPDGTPRPVDEAPPLRALRGEPVMDQEEIVRTPATGQLRHRQVNAAPVRNPDGVIIGSVSVVRDITERKRAEEALQKAKDELEERVQERTEELAKSRHRLQQLSSQLLLAQEKERKRVAVELHDGLLSELAAMKYLLEGKLMLLDKGTPVDPAGMRRIADILGLTMKEARRIMNNLHPSVLDELGFLAAMRWICGEFQKSYPHISVQTEIGVFENDISDGIRIVIFRVLQEALNNFAKHGKGDRVEVSLSKSEGIFSFAIRDNGQGFDMDKVEKGLGLESMGERVELSGGEFRVETAIGQGSTIRAIWRS